uniref:Ig-like domain-containing protein n=1 Tax=Sinocyclocheilus grahami TaxID=75366 RepID=A0A672MVF6_SINGR
MQLRKNWTFLIFQFSGDSDVSQVPSVLMAVNGSSVQLNCTHKKDSSFVQMYWYRQRPGQTMTLIVFTSTLSSKHDYADSDPNKFPAIKTVPESGSLTVNNVESDDSAVYFCSVRQHTTVFYLPSKRIQSELYKKLSRLFQALSLQSAGVAVEQSTSHQIKFAHS